MQGALLTSNYLMKISASDVRIGNLVEYQGKLWRILKKSHVKPGKGGAFAQLEMKAISDNTKLNERFRSEDKLEKPTLNPDKCNICILMARTLSLWTSKHLSKCRLQKMI